MSQAKKRKTAGPTILDYLNDDCWKYVLDYLDLEEVIISELVSRRWQAIVLTYLQTVRVALNDHEWSVPKATPWPRVRWLELEEKEWHLFERWAKKLGSTVVFAFCSSEKQLDIIRKNCPNVESLTCPERLRDAFDFPGIPSSDPDMVIMESPQEYTEKDTTNGLNIARFAEPISINYKNKSFKRLQKLRFEHCFSVTDRCVSQFINSSVTELEILGDAEADFTMKGKFLNSVNSKLQSLSLTHMELRLNYLLSDCLSELKKMHLSDIPSKIFENIHLVFDKTPKLEDLHLRFYSYGLDVSKHVCRLPNLKHLEGNVVSTDEDLEAVTRGCKELRYLKMCHNTVSMRGLQAMCRHAGSHLVHLDLGNNSTLTDADLAVCVRGCTALTELEAGGCHNLTAQLRPLAEEARRAVSPRPPPLLVRRGWSTFTIE